jgi:DNA polymerase III epsilon subunit-like protein
MDNKFLFFDTETTGLSRDSYLVQVAWILTYDDGEVISQNEFIVKPDGYEIPYRTSVIHGITTSMAHKDGVALNEVLKAFTVDADKTTYIVGHNISFDLAIMKTAYKNASMKFPLESKTKFDTMTESTQWCQLPKANGAAGYKRPKLKELYYKLFGEYFDDAHSAYADTKATMESFFELVDIGVIDLQPSEKASDHRPKPRYPRKEKINDQSLQKSSWAISLTEKIDALDDEIKTLKSFSYELIKDKYTWHKKQMVKAFDKWQTDTETYLSNNDESNKIVIKKFLKGYLEPQTSKRDGLLVEEAFQDRLNFSVDLQKLILVDATANLNNEQPKGIFPPTGFPFDGRSFGLYLDLKIFKSQYKNAKIVVIFDGKDLNLGLDIEDDLFTQSEIHSHIDNLLKIIRLKGFYLICENKVESKDIIATLSRLAIEKNIETLISTNNKQLYGLAGSKVKLKDFSGKIWGQEEIDAKIDLKSHLVDLKLDTPISLNIFDDEPIENSEDLKVLFDELGMSSVWL